MMLKTHEAIIDSNGIIKFKENVKTQAPKKVLVIFLDDLTSEIADVAFSEAALAKDWSRTEEDEAWVHLQKAQ